MPFFNGEQTGFFYPMTDARKGKKTRKQKKQNKQIRRV